MVKQHHLFHVPHWLHDFLQFFALCIQQYVQGYRSSADIFTRILEKYLGAT